MKKFTLFLMTMMVSVISLFAQEPAAPKFSALATDGETVQYLYNVETHAFVLGANDWNTRASVSVEKGYKFKIADNGNGTYTLNDYVETQNAWKAVFAGNATDIWVDNLGGANVKGWVITSVGENLYKITNPGASATGELSVIQDLSDTRLNLNVSNPEAYGATWALVSEDDYAEYIASYDVEAVKEYAASKKESVTAALQGVIDEANRASIEARENLANATNIYGEGYDEWVAKTAEFKGLVEAGNYTEKIVNPNAITGWHSSTEFNFLLTPWTVGGEQANKFDKALYINTWSTEGVSDGSNFLVPFFEYWTGDDNSLGANVLEAKVEGLVAGKAYDVEAWTRVRVKNGQNGAAPYGITLQAGDGEAVNACGEQVGTTQMYLTKVAAKGKADENGVLSIKYNIDADNNISWLSYKDVKYTEAAPELAKFEAGDYFLYNVEANAWLGGANSWGTQGSVVAHPQRFTVAVNEDGTYTLDSHTYNSAANHFFGTNLYVDSPAANWTINVVDGGYTLSAEAGKFVASAAESTVIETVDDMNNAAAVWKIYSEADMIKALEEGEMTDATFAIKAAGFGRNLYGAKGSETAWTIEEGCTNKNLNGGANENMCAESFHSPFNIHQVITGMPNGKYTFKAQGFYRQDGEDTENMPVFYANGASQVFPEKTGTENSMTDASKSFTEGLYTIDAFEFEVTDGTIDLGVKNENATLWCIWDNIEIAIVPAQPEEPAITSVEITFDAEEGAEIDLAETKSIHVAIACPEGIEKDAELLINGAIIDKDGNSTPVTAFTDFEDCTDAAISQLTPGETYTLVINKVAFGEVIGVEDDMFTPIYKNTIVAEEGSSLASLTFSIKAEAEPEIAGTKFNIAPGGNCELPIPADAVRVFNFSGQWASCAPTTNSFDAAIYKNVTVEFEEALEFYFNTPYKDATGAQQWGGAAVGTTTFVLDLATVGSITDFSIQNVSTDPTNFTIKNAYATKLDDTVEPLIFAPGGWGVAMNVDGVTDGVATFKGQWAGLNVDNSILNKEGKKTLRVYANQPIPTTAQWCVKYADDNTDGWPQLGISETDPTYAECVIDRPVSSIFLQWTVAEVGSIDIKAITWEIEEATAIESIETADNTSVKKMMVNGKLVIVKGGKTYNVAGALIK